MKTSHELARELLAGPDLPIFHLDPSLLAYGEHKLAFTGAVISMEKEQNFDDADDPCVRPFIAITSERPSEALYQIWEDIEHCEDLKLALEVCEAAYVEGFNESMERKLSDTRAAADHFAVSAVNKRLKEFQPETP